MENINAAIEAAFEEYVKALKGGNSEEIAAQYTENAKLLPPNTKMVIGRQAIGLYWKENMNPEIKDVKLETVEVQVREDIAYQVGKFAISYEPASGLTITIEGKSLYVWKRQDDSWKMDVDIWNIDIPLKG